MLVHALVGALAFSAPPSLTRRDMAVGLGAAFAGVAAPAFADASKYAGAADKRKAEKLEAKIAAEGGPKPTPYAQLTSASTLPAEIKQPPGAYGANGKDANGVSNRKPYDPNGC